MDLEVRHLRCFLVLAEELNFTRAASRLGVPQPALSTQIRRIERHLGKPLFDRTTRSVVLTEAGRRMLPLARNVDQAMHALEDAMHEPGAARRLRFGTEDHPLRGQVTAVEAAFPGLSFEVRTVEPPASFEALAAGGLDIVFAYDSPLLPMAVGSDLRVATVTDMPWWVALPRQHRLAGSERVSLQDLASDAWFARPADTSLYRITIGSCQQYGGFTPDIRYTTIRTDVMFELLEQGRAVGLAAPTAERYGGPFEVVPLVEEFGRRLVLAWRPGTVPTGVAEAMLRNMRGLFADFARESPRFCKEVLSAPEKYPHLHPLLTPD
jgi:DNA-binding transcriptional LysR family regulator